MIEQFTSSVAVNNSQEPWLVGEGVVVSGSVAIPSLDFDFITGGLPSSITFTRASTATFFNSAGVLTSAAADQPRFDYNPSTLAAQGLLIEEARTNLLTYSEQFDNAASWAATGAGGTVTANQAVAPDGNTTADQLTFTANAVSGVRQNVTLTAVSHTLSCWMRSISGTATARLKYFNGTTDAFSSDFTLTTTWQRFSFTFTGVAVAGNISINNGTAGAIQNIYIWGAQLEAGAFPTSYIPTTVAQVTRNADQASVNTLSPWYNASEGTLYANVAVDYTMPGGIFPALASLNDNTSGNRIELGFVTSAVASFEIAVGGPIVTSRYPSTAALNRRVSGAYKANDSAVAVNGAAAQATTPTFASLPTVTKLDIGARGSGARFTGWIQRITYYPRKLSSAELQAITA